MASAVSTGVGLRLDHVSRVFRRTGGSLVHAVDDVSIVIPVQQFVCLIGPSGCGKSTLLQMLAGLQPINSGEISLDGQPIAGPSPERGLVFQRDSVFPWMRVLDNAVYGLASRGVDKQARLATA